MSGTEHMSNKHTESRKRDRMMIDGIRGMLGMAPLYCEDVEERRGHEGFSSRSSRE